MIICTANGAKALAPDGSDEPGAPHQHCTMCVMVAAIALALLALTLLGILRPAAAGHRLDWQRGLPIRSYLDRCGFLSRAPPLTA
jgi:hypothetical protein